MRTGAVVTNGTDAPVEDVDPLASYYATVSRRTSNGGVFFGDQRMSRVEALRCHEGFIKALEELVRGAVGGPALACGLGMKRCPAHCGACPIN